MLKNQFPWKAKNLVLELLDKTGYKTNGYTKNYDDYSTKHCNVHFSSDTGVISYKPAEQTHLY